MEIYPKKSPNYPPKMAKYLLDFTFHNKKKKTFGTLDFRKKRVFLFLVFGFWIFGFQGILT
jgi:hypothetical protein